MASVHQPTSSDPTPTDEDAPTRDARARALVLCGAGLLFGAGLGTLDLWAPDEPRYAAIAEELRSFRHGLRGLVLLHLNDVPYSQKPPLYFWLAALAGAPSDRVTEFAARLPSALAAFATVALLLPIGRRLLGRVVPACLAAGLLATSFRFVFTARRAQLDLVLTAFEWSAVALFLHLESRPGGLASAGSRPGRVALLHGALGAAALVKGPVGWLPLACFAAYLAWEGRLREFRAIAAPRWAWALSIGPLALWGAAAISLAPPGFSEVALGDNLWGRIFEGTSHARPIYYYVYQLPLDFLPASILLPFGLVVAWRRARGPSATLAGTAGLAEDARGASRSSARFLLVWALLPLILFSLSAGKRGVYLLPIFPALALISVLGLDRLLPDPSPAWRERRLAGWIAGLAAMELLAALVVLPRLDAVKSPRPIAQSIATRLAPGEAIGVYGLTPIEGALAYYGRGGVGRNPVISLGSEPALRAFLGGNGQRFVLLRERHWRKLGPPLGLTAVDHFRSGRRQLTLAATRPGNPEGEGSAPLRTLP